MKIRLHHQFNMNHLAYQILMTAKHGNHQYDWHNFYPWLDELDPAYQKLIHGMLDDLAGGLVNLQSGILKAVKKEKEQQSYKKYKMEQQQAQVKAYVGYGQSIADMADKQAYDLAYQQNVAMTNQLKPGGKWTVK